MFGRQGTPYDFTGINVQGLRDKARELENQQKSMKKKVNPKAMNMIDRYDIFFMYGTPVLMLSC